MKTRPYHNVFVSYRGPSTRTQADVDQQLEDNATKALINALELSPQSRELVGSFLNRFVDPSLELLQQPSFFLQPRAGVTAPRRHLLGVSTSGKLPAFSGDLETGAGAGRADAAIVVSGELVLAVEVKVGEGELERAQLERHAATWGVMSENDWHVCRRKDVYAWATSEFAAASEPVTRFLLEQLIEFLAVASLAPFLGLEEADFEFFGRPVADRDELRRPILRARLAALVEELALTMPDDIRLSLGGPRVQPLRRDDPAAAVVWPGGQSDVNLTIEIGPRDLQLNLVGWNDPQTRTLLRWLRSPQATEWLHAHSGFELVVYRRWPRNRFERDGVEHPIWQNSNSTELDDRIPAERFTVEQLDALLVQIGDPKWNKPGFHLRRPWPKETAVALAEGVVVELAGGLGDLQRLCEVINGTATATTP